MTHVMVVGGGLAGLAAATAVVDGGAQVTLLEASPRLGGAAGSFRRGALVLDTGQHVFLRCCHAYRWLLRRVGTAHLAPVQDRLRIPVRAPGGRRAELSRTGLPAPLHLLPSLSRFGLLPPADRGRAIAAAARLARRPRGDDDITFGQWLRDHGQGPDAVARLWDLIALPTLNLPADEASLDLATMVFQTGLLERRDAADLGIPAVPLEELHAAPTARAIRDGGGQVHTGRRVRAVEPDRDGLAVHEADGTTHHADAVVVAVPPEEVSPLLPPGTITPPGAPGRLGAVPIVNVHLHYDRRVLDLPFAAGVDTPVQYVFDRTVASGATHGQVLSVSLSGAEEQQDQRRDVLVDAHHRALQQLFPEVARARLVDAAVVRMPQATIRQVPGVDRWRPGHATTMPGVFLAGAWTDTGWPATMEGAVRSGLRAARAALDVPTRSRTEVAA